MSKSITRRTAKKQPDLQFFEGLNCVNVLKALGEDNRSRIVALLLEGPLGVTEIARRLDSTEYNVSKHLRILRNAGVLEMEKNGQERLYAVPKRIRRTRTHVRVLDLGGCSFQFDR